jgi:hypothetical protein
MVVREDRAGGGHADEWAKDFTRVHLDADGRAAADLDDIEESVADVEPDHEEELLRVTVEARRREAVDIVGVANGGAVRAELNGAAAELEGGGDAGGTCRTELRLELARRGAREMRDVADGFEE